MCGQCFIASAEREGQSCLIIHFCELKAHSSHLRLQQQNASLTIMSSAIFISIKQVPMSSHLDSLCKTGCMNE